MGGPVIGAAAGGGPTMTPLVLGAGAVGVQAARQLEATPGIDRVFLADADRRKCETASEGMASVTTLGWPLASLPDDVSVVVAALAPGADRSAAEAAVEAGVPFASCADDVEAVRALFDLSPAAHASGVTVVAGAGLAPGLSEVLAAYAAESLQEVDGIDVARFSASGRACQLVAARAARGRATDFEGGALGRPRAGSGRRLVYFPPPVGPQDCRRAESAVPLLARRAVSGLRRVDVRHASPLWAPRLGAWVGRRTQARADLGALHVEVSGSQGRARRVLTLGAVDRIASLTGAILATAAAIVAGLGPFPASETGTRGFAELGPPRALLAELAARGVRAARFDGRG
ncbi:MAG: hypothetical protein HYU28_06790 [Actinobacteria bacterium]|nr:hypothetical protein [Actinomycetota bacterium]